MVGAISGRVATGVGLAAATAAAMGMAVAAWAYRSKAAAQSLQWVEVGRVEELLLYPVKSGGGIHITTAKATSYGFVVGGLTDRSFVVVSTGTHVTVTSGVAPMLCTIHVSLLPGRVLVLTPQQGDPFHLDMDQVMTAQPAELKLKLETLKGLDCGNRVALWLSQQLYGGEEEKVRLMFVGDIQKFRRPARKPNYFEFPQFKKEDVQLYHDNCAYMVTTTASMADLNGRLTRVIPHSQLRPNIVVACNAGSPAFDEDHWTYVRIGNGDTAVTLRTLKPRDTCIRINVNPKTGERQNEVIEELKKYRTPKYPEKLARQWSMKPVFGILLALEGRSGLVNVGDVVYAVRDTSVLTF